MSILREVLVLLLGVLFGALFSIVRQKVIKRNNEKQKEIDDSHKIECEECDIEFFVEEWKKTIEVQQHFNDLIIRFRSIVLSVFIASLGFIYGISEKLNFTDAIKVKWFLLAIVFWICCFIMDYFYYHQLLIGSVKHACKFDNNDFFRKKGLFGLTKTIGLQVSPNSTKVLILFFYWLPIICLLIIMYLKYFPYVRI